MAHQSPEYPRKTIVKVEVEGLKILSGMAGAKVEKGTKLADIYAKFSANSSSGERADPQRRHCDL